LLPICHWGTCSSSAARFAAHARSATVSRSTISRVSRPVELPGLGTLTRRTQSGACRALFFSKNACPSTPSGHRVKVTGRPDRCGSSTGAIRT